jgi:hypothetical protein
MSPINLDRVGISSINRLRGRSSGVYRWFKASDKAKEKMRIAKLGTKQSPEHREKIKASRTTEAAVKAASAASKDRWADPKYRTKMLEAQRLRRERERLEKEAVD